MAELNMTAYKTALEREREQMSLAAWEETLHPRLHGKFVKKFQSDVRSLHNPDSPSAPYDRKTGIVKPAEAKLPDGAGVRRVSHSEYVSFGPPHKAGTDQGRSDHHSSADEAVKAALQKTDTTHAAYQGPAARATAAGEDVFGARQRATANRRTRKRSGSGGRANEARQRAIDRAQSRRLRAAKGRPVGDMGSAIRSIVSNAATGSLSAEVDEDAIERHKLELSLFTEELHPRGETGSGQGGKFVAKGSSGNGVKKIQAKVGAKQDGQFGSKTAAAVRKYQQQHGLQVDGIVGHQTLTALKGGGTKAKVGSLTSSDKKFVEGG